MKKNLEWGQQIMLFPMQISVTHSDIVAESLKHRNNLNVLQFSQVPVCGWKQYN